MPVWVTPEVLQGGIASRHMAARKPAGMEGHHNLDLQDLLHSGRYELQYPEHGALLVACALSSHGRDAAAERLLAEIEPYQDTLQFFPVVSTTPLQPRATASVTTVAALRRQLRQLVERANDARRRPVRRRAYRTAALTGWIPLRHGLLALFARTTECAHTPLYVIDTPPVPGHDFHKGVAKCSATGAPIFVTYPECPRHTATAGCGWPLQRFDSPGWARDARVLYDQLQALKAAGWNNEYGRRGTTLHALVTCLEACIAAHCGDCAEGCDGGAGSASSGMMIPGLDGRIVSCVRAALAGWNTTRGLPGSDTFAAYAHRIYRAGQTIGNVGTATAAAVAALDVILANCEPSRGLEQPEVLLQHVAVEGRPPIPDAVRKAVLRAREGTIPALVEHGVITSAEMLATVVPQLTASIASGCLTPTDSPSLYALKRLLYALHRSFSARRSLLLHDLSHQVHIDEIPWVTALRALIRENEPEANANEAAIARATLVDLIVEELTWFPYTIVPNAMLRCFRQLATAASIPAPILLLDELAADIFEGRFSTKFAAAARYVAARPPALYAAYYRLDDTYASIRDKVHSDVAVDVAVEVDSFVALCHARAGVSARAPSSSSGWSGCGQSGRIIEQQQTVTTHNLAWLTDGRVAGLEKVSARLPWADMVHRTWQWISHAFRSRVPPVSEMRGRLCLRLRKDIAYAWRQLVYYLSQLPPHVQREILTDMVNGPSDTTSARENSSSHAVALFARPLLAMLHRHHGDDVERVVDSETDDATLLAPVYGWTTELPFYEDELAVWRTEHH